MWLTKKVGTPYLYARWQHPDGSGRVLSQSTGEKTPRAAEAKGKQFEETHRAEWERGQRGGAVGSQQVIEEYWQTELKLKKWAPSAEVHLERISTFLGDRRYCDVTISDVAQFVDGLVSDQSVSDSTINRVLAVWRRMHNVAGDIREYPVTKIRWAALMRDEPEGRTRHLKPDEIKTLLAVLPMHLKEIVVFAILTGARRSQIVTLTWDRVDLAHGTAVVFKKSRKKDVQHTIELNEGAVEILNQRLVVYGAPDIYPKTHDRCFDDTNFQHGWEKAVRESGLKDLRFHDLRHTFASFLARKSSLAVVRQQLGHSDLRMTLRYAHVQQEDVKAGVRALPIIDIDPQAGS